MFRNPRRRPRRTPTRPTAFAASLETLAALHNSPALTHRAVRHHSRR
jgi:hypothetical protein